MRRHVPGELGGPEVLVHGVHARQQLRETVGTDRDHQRGADRGVQGVAAADPVPEAEGVVGVDPELRDLVERGRDRDEVLRDRRGLVLARQPVEQPGPAEPGVGQRLERAERLARHDEQRGRGVETCQRRRAVGRVDVADEPALQAVLDVRRQRLVRHHRAEVGAADPDVDDRPDPLARGPRPRAGADLLGERVDAAEDVVHGGHDVLAVDLQSGVGGQPERGVKHRPVLRDIDPRAGEHRVAPLGQTHLVAEVEQCCEHLVVDQVLRQVDPEVGRRQREPLDAAGVVLEPGPQVGGEAGRQLCQASPGGRGGGVDGGFTRACRHRRAASSDSSRVLSMASQAVTNFSTPSLIRTWMTSS